MKRPTINDDEIIKIAAAALAPKVIKWMKSEDWSLGDSPTVEEVADDLEKAMRWGNDGYDIAKNLDTKGYSPDEQLVDVLSQAFTLTRNALIAAEVEWVKASGAQPIPIESKVRWKRKHQELVGIVTSNHQDGKSTVMYPDLGHIREGVGSHGYIIQWEELEVVE